MGIIRKNFQTSDALDILLEEGFEKYGADLETHELADAVCSKGDFFTFRRGFTLAQKVTESLPVMVQIEREIFMYEEPGYGEHVLFFIGREPDILKKVVKAMKDMKSD